VGRAAALLGLAALLGVYYGVVTSLRDISLWWDVAWLALVVFPAVFLLVWLVLPLWNARGLFLVALACVAVTVALHLAGADVLANFAKLATMTFIAFWFLTWFETVGWVVLVALVVPWVDAYSVWRGPTHDIVKHQKHLFTTLSFAFPVPGEHGTANLGLPDLLFFGLYLAASVRFGLRPFLTWALLTASFGATVALAVAFEVGGLPALPLLSVGFLVANGDLLWRRLRRPRGELEPGRG